MRQDDFRIRHIFAENTELPQIVRDKAEQAYAMIAAQTHDAALPQRAGSPKPRAWRLPRAAGIMLACILAVGGTAAAATVISRWDRLQDMDGEDIAKYYEDIQTSGHLAYLPSRPFTETEEERLAELEKAYKKNLRFPDAELTRLQEGDVYSGRGVCLLITEAGEENILYLPETELTDEELLEIIEYLVKQDYAFYETNRSQALGKDNWESRLAGMTDEEVDYYYLAFWKSQMPTMDGYCRGDDGDAALTASETARYQELSIAYEEENLFPAGEATVIERAGDYTGIGVSICRYDGNFYLPETELTDEELLEIVDFRKKAYYSQSRIEEEIRLGYRTEYPKLSEERSHAAEPVWEIAPKAFADTSGQGSLKTVEDARIGDIVRFGSYDQDNNPSNGQEPIEWYVLDETADTMTLLAVKLLDQGVYHSEMLPVTWEDSAIRKWLNEEFYQTAFSQEEQSRILSATVRNEGAADTNDRVYLLSSEEFYAYFGVQPDPDRCKERTSFYDDLLEGVSNHEKYDSRIFAEATETAHANGVGRWDEETIADFLKFENVDMTCAKGQSDWWLRTSCDKFGPSAHVIEATGIFDSHQYVTSAYGIRPVVQISR